MPIRLAGTVKTLLIISLAAFLVQQTGDQFLGTHLMGWFALVPGLFVAGHRYWQLLTYSFMHQDVMHLIFDLLMLAFIGSELEFLWGSRRFLKFYFFCSVSAGVVYLVAHLLLNKNLGALSPMLGASGAVYGLLVAYGLLFGERVMLFMMLFPMKAKHFVWILALMELLTSAYSGGGGLASLAHLGGMGFGFLYLWLAATASIAAKKRNGSKGVLDRFKKKKSKHLKLVVNNERESETGFESEDESHEDPKTWH